MISYAWSETGRVRFVAEVSSNHHRDLSRCLKFIDAAADAGCDAVKFQLFRIKELFSHEILARSAKHRERAAWELPVAMLSPLAEHCHSRGIGFLCTPFYLEAVDQLMPHVDAYKIASYELLWHDLIRKCAATGKPLILSTGMATTEEICAAVNTAREAGGSAPTLLHAVSAYPTPPAQANLRCIETLRQRTGCAVGWSDHTVSPGVIARAVHHFGASIVEFHLDLDGTGAEYAMGHCWLPDDIARLIRNIREGLHADGDGVKMPAPAEAMERDWRADPGDGLRPLRGLRDTFRGDEA